MIVVLFSNMFDKDSNGILDVNEWARFVRANFAGQKSVTADDIIDVRFCCWEKSIVFLFYFDFILYLICRVLSMWIRIKTGRLLLMNFWSL